MQTPSLEIYLQRLDTHFGARYSQDTVKNAHSQAAAFLRKMGVKPAYGRRELLAYVDYLIAQGYRPRSILVMMGHVKTLFAANDIPWPLLTSDMHLGIPKGETSAPLTSSDAIARLISGTRRLGPPDGPAVALSTTWGLRSIELTTVLNAGCDGRLLVVQSAKGGEVRRHTIPPELQLLLRFSPFPISRDGVQHLFDRLILQHVGKAQAREGWHALRRSVVTALVQAGLSESVLYRFMGWKRSDMIYRYWRPGQQDIDDQVYALHPFLAFYSKPL